MELILQQMPIVVHSLNIGFLQTLRLFLVTLIGAFPLGLIIAFGSMSQFKPLSYFTKVIVWIVRGTPLMNQPWEIIDDQKLDHQRGTTDHPDDQSRKPAKRLKMRHGAKGNDQSERKGADQRHNK